MPEKIIRKVRYQRSYGMGAEKGDKKYQFWQVKMQVVVLKYSNRT